MTYQNTSNTPAIVRGQTGESPTELRLTLREAARLQTFPDGYVFHGSSSDVATMIGNAIPPHFAKVLCVAGIETATRAPKKDLPGGIMQFEATASAGMSPALQRITHLITERYLRVQTPDTLQP